MEHIKAWKWSRRSASLWSPRSLALMNSWGGAQCSHSEIGRMTDALALSLRPSNVNEFKWPAPYPSLSSPSLPSILFLSHHWTEPIPALASSSRFGLMNSAGSALALHAHPFKELCSWIYLQEYYMHFNHFISIHHKLRLKEGLWVIAKPVRRHPSALFAKEAEVHRFVGISDSSFAQQEGHLIYQEVCSFKINFA